MGVSSANERVTREENTENTGCGGTRRQKNHEFGGTVCPLVQSLPIITVHLRLR